MSRISKMVLTAGFAVLMAASLTGGVYAAKKVQENSQNGQSFEMPKIFIYQQPDASSPHTKVDLSTPLINIFQKGDWVKVGNKHNGDTGWINLKQVSQAQADWQSQMNKDYQVVKTKKIPGGILKITQGQKDGMRYTIVEKEINKQTHVDKTQDNEALKQVYRQQQLMNHQMNQTLSETNWQQTQNSINQQMQMIEQMNTNLLQLQAQNSQKEQITK